MSAAGFRSPVSAGAGGTATPAPAAPPAGFSILCLISPPRRGTDAPGGLGGYIPTHYRPVARFGSYQGLVGQ